MTARAWGLVMNNPARCQCLPEARAAVNRGWRLHGMRRGASRNTMRLSAAVFLSVLLPAVALAGPAEERIAEGVAALEARNVVGAMEAFTAALDAEPANVRAAYERGRLLLAIGEPKNAVADFTTAILGDPSFGRAYVGRAQAKLVLKDGESAIADFNKAIEAAPRDADVHVARAAFRLSIGNLPGAREDLVNAKAAADEATAQKIDQMLKKLGGP